MNNNELIEVQNKLSNLDYLLDRKLFLLEEILKISMEQSITFKSTSEEANLKIQKDIDLKQSIIDELLSIDDMFISIFKSFSGFLNQNPKMLRKEIFDMQTKIKSISKVDLKIRVQEDKNKQIFATYHNLTNNNTNVNSINNNNSDLNTFDVSNNNANLSSSSNINLNNNIINTKKQSLINKYQQNNTFY
ncbi:MAG: hypothetical protein R3Y29_02765 [bacterium]